MAQKGTNWTYISSAANKGGHQRNNAIEPVCLAWTWLDYGRTGEALGQREVREK